MGATNSRLSRASRRSSASTPEIRQDSWGLPPAHAAPATGPSPHASRDAASRSRPPYLHGEAIVISARHGGKEHRGGHRRAHEEKRLPDDNAQMPAPQARHRLQRRLDSKGGDRGHQQPASRNA